MTEKNILKVLTLIIALLLPVVAGGQVPVRVSDQKIVTGGKVYYMHHVLKGQTLYSISRTYQVTYDDISDNNVIPPNGIQTDQILKIPASASLTASQATPRAASQPQAESRAASQPQAKSQPQPASRPDPNPGPQAEVQSQSQLTGDKESSGPVEKEPSGPGGKEASKVQDQPQAQAQAQSPPQPTSQLSSRAAGNKPETKTAKVEDHISHKVKKGESISSLAGKYGVSERDIRKANKGLLFPMPGMYLVIPKNDENSGEETEK